MFAKLRESKAKLLTWLICGLLCFLIQILLAPEELVGDAAGYWMLGESFWENGKFTLWKAGGFRGYVFPVFLGACSHYVGEAGWRVVNAAVVSSIFAIIVPNLSCVGGGQKVIFY